MKKIFSILALSLFILNACIPHATAPSSPIPDEFSGHEPIGGETDENGCLGPAGYSYDEEIGACTRVWEIENENTRKAAKMAVEEVGKSKGLTVTEVLVLRCPGCFTVTLQVGEKHPKENVAVNIVDWEVRAQPATISHTLGQSCEIDLDCQTPMEFMIQSNCPFGSACIDSQCVVVCPLFQQCAVDSDCNCSDRGQKTLDCVCLEGSCLSVEAQDEIYPE